MSASNKTTNYSLPQFVGSDNPEWLVDFNGAMGKLDSTLYGMRYDILRADGKANAASKATLKFRWNQLAIESLDSRVDDVSLNQLNPPLFNAGSGIISIGDINVTLSETPTLGGNPNLSLCLFSGAINIENVLYNNLYCLISNNEYKMKLEKSDGTTLNVTQLENPEIFKIPCVINASYVSGFEVIVKMSDVVKYWPSSGVASLHLKGFMIYKEED